MVDSSTKKDSPESAEAAEEPPFPWMAMTSLSLGMLAHSVVFTAPLPYVAFMIVDFHMAADVDSAGYAAGWITGMFMIGRTLAGIPWGMIADRYGRRLCLVLSMVNISIFGLIFGFSTSFFMAIFLRFLIGVGNGFMGIAKTSVTEITHNKSQEVQAFSIINGVWGLGMIVGPAIGGFLARPAVLYPSTFSSTSLWGRYPYLMPCLVCSAIAAAAAIGVLLFVPETLAPRSRDYDQLSSESAHGEQPPTEVEMTEIKDVEAQTCSPSSTREGEKVISFEDPSSSEEPSSAWYGEDLPRFTPHSPDNKGEEEEEEQEEEDKIKELSPIPSKTDAERLPSTFLEIISSRRIQVVFLIYFMICFCVLMTDEAFPLWAVTSVRNGGLSWESTQVGEMLASIGIGLIIFQLFLYKPCLSMCCLPDDAVGTFVRCIAAMAVFLMLVPVLTDVTMRWAEGQVDDASTVSYSDNGVDTRGNVGLHVVLTLVWLCYRLPATAAFTTLAMIVNASVDASMRGTMNGLIMVSGSLGNALGPIIGSILYAAALRAAYPHPDAPHHRNMLPIDGRIVFFLTGGMALLLAWVAKHHLVDPCSRR